MKKRLAIALISGLAILPFTPGVSVAAPKTPTEATCLHLWCQDQSCLLEDSVLLLNCDSLQDKDQLQTRDQDRLYSKECTPDRDRDQDRTHDRTGKR